MFGVWRALGALVLLGVLPPPSQEDLRLLLPGQTQKGLLSLLRGLGPWRQKLLQQRRYRLGAARVQLLGE